MDYFLPDKGQALWFCYNQKVTCRSQASVNGHPWVQMKVLKTLHHASPKNKGILLGNHNAIIRHPFRGNFCSQKAFLLTKEQALVLRTLCLLLHCLLFNVQNETSRTEIETVTDSRMADRGRRPGEPTARSRAARGGPLHSTTPARSNRLRRPLDAPPP